MARGRPRKYETSEEMVEARRKRRRERYHIKAFEQRMAELNRDTSGGSLYNVSGGRPQENHAATSNMQYTFQLQHGELRNGAKTTSPALTGKKHALLSPPIRTFVPTPEGRSTLPITPLYPDGRSAPVMGDLPLAISTAVHVLSTEREALAHVERIYMTDNLARDSMERAVMAIANSVNTGGKVVISGVGKSRTIGEKVVATMNSLGIQSTSLHPTEALHGDLGMNDTILLISFSGKTPELLLLLSHLPATVTVIALTAHMHPSLCPLITSSRSINSILLPSPVHEHEIVSFGLAAPASSTTVALALGDALALATARRLHTSPGKGPAEVFKGFHPGGAIGAALAATMTPISEPTPTLAPTRPPGPGTESPEKGLRSSPVLLPLEETSVSDRGIPFNIIPLISPSNPKQPAQTSIMDILRTAVRSPTAKSWVLLSPTEVLPPRRVCALAEENDVSKLLATIPNLDDVVVPRKDWLCVSRASTVREVTQLVAAHNGKANTRPSGLVIAVMDEVSGGVISLLEEKDLQKDAT
ncbi:hypothetical protein FQN55_006861 [Onygenales sp. PD_40]|nr:hypothetical protein FQN55_006861 [Onygenales sp. PD_40]KAK2784277.1 hypothetical protein FQN52_009082 [Onygenales sp. PD_12]KAK2805675.1 hypothetical protein FQN51_009178 [Onygenales sp. PD_10]